MKLLFGELYRYAVFKDIVRKDLSIWVKAPKQDDRKEKVPFTLEEIETLRSSSDEFAKLVYVMIYTGFRASEFIAIRRQDISNDYVITGGIKSSAGKDRRVPCNSKIIPVIDELFSDGRDYLVGCRMSYNQFIYRFKKTMQALGMSHTPHDTRHTFVTLLSNADANKVSIQRLVGHASQGVTDSVYTHKNIEQLKKAIEMI
jgi:integrase